MMFKRLYFTLMELMIAISIIALVSSVIGIGIFKARKQQRFNSAVQLVADKLQMAQDLMLLLKTDIKVQFSKDPDKPQSIVCNIKMNRELDSGTKKLINTRSTISGISSIVFTNDQNEIVRDHFQLIFYSNGSKMNRGILDFYGSSEYSNEDALHKQILLVGYPQPITVSNDNIRRLDSNPVDDVYPVEALQEWREAHENPKGNQRRKAE